MTGWRPMSSAPRDGTVVDLWVRGRRKADCYWSYTMQDGKRLPDGPFDGWCCDTGKSGPSGFNPYPNLIEGKPTAWRPIEPGPSHEELQGERG